MLLVDPRERAGLVEVAEGLVDESGALNENWLRFADAVVLPEESALHFDDLQCRRLAAALRAVGVDELVAVPFEDPDDGFDSYVLNVAPEDLRDFSIECGSFRYVLFPDVAEPSVAVVCTTDDYFLVAGKCEFVKAFAGDLAEAERQFLAFVEARLDDVKPSLIPAVRYLLGEWGARNCEPRLALEN